MKDFNKILSDAYYVKMVGDPYFGIANTETVRNRIYALYNADKDTYRDQVRNLLNENKDQLINIMGCILSTEKSAKKLGISLTALFKESYNELQQPENDNTDNSNPDDNTDNSNPDDNTDDSNPDDNTGNSNPDDNTDNSNPDDNTDNSNPDDNTDDNTDNSNPDDNTDNSNPDDNTDDNTDNSNPDDNTDNSNPEVEEELKLFGRDLGIYLNSYTMLDATRDGAFMPIINRYRINCINCICKLKQHIGKENIKLADAIINALKDADGVKALFDLYICFYESGFNVMNKEHCTKALEFLKDYLPKPKPEEDPKDPDPKDPSDSGAAIDPLEEIFESIEVANVKSEVRSPLETIATSGGTENKKPSIPDVEEAYLLNGKELSDSNLVTFLKNKITVLEGRNVSRNSINMLLNLVMNNQDGFVTKLINLGAKIPLEIKEVKVTKYATDKNRFDTVFEVATDTEPIVFFYHWDPILNEEGTAWSYDALVLPFDKVTLTKDAKTKKAKADSKRQKKTKKQMDPAPQPQTMTATA